MGVKITATSDSKINESPEHGVKYNLKLID